MSGEDERLRAGLAQLAEAAERVVNPPPPARIRARARARSRRQAIAGTAMVAVTVGGAWGAWSVGGHDAVVPSAPTAPPTTVTATPEPSPETPVDCRADDVTVMLTSLPPVDDHRGLVVVFQAKDRPCRLAGYPSVVPVFDYERSMEPAAWTPSGYFGGVTGDPGPVIVEPARPASVLVEATVGDPGCARFGVFELTLPGDRTAIPIGWATDACQELEVHPFVPGETGSQ